jgi:beta-phosphoglucomutase-like phosphatase (HAD superfamily)
VVAKKPDPAVYLLVAQRCGVKPEDCLVVEDTGHGLQAALAAGMSCIVTPSELARNDSFAGAMRRFENLEGVDLPSLRKMWAGE